MGINMVVVALPPFTAFLLLLLHFAVIKNQLISNTKYFHKLLINNFVLIIANGRQAAATDSSTEQYRVPLSLCCYCRCAVVHLLLAWLANSKHQIIIAKSLSCINFNIYGIIKSKTLLRQSTEAVIAAAGRFPMRATKPIALVIATETAATTTSAMATPTDIATYFTSTLIVRLK